jgi:hypothetical protein
MEKYGTARQATGGNIVRRMRFACWIINAAYAHSEYVIHISFLRNSAYANAPSCYVTRTLPVLY